MLALLAACGCRSRATLSADPFSTWDDVPGTSLSEAGDVIPAGYDEPDASLSVSVSDDAPKPGVDDALDKLSPKKLADGVKSALGYGPDRKVAEALYAEGESLFAEKKYTDAAARFKQAAARWPDSMLEEDALFMQAESEFQSDQYYRASNTFHNLLKRFENSRHLDKVVSRQFAIARYWEDAARTHSAWVPNLTDKTRPWLDSSSNAVAIYQSIRQNDPTGPLADDAVMAQANSYFLRNRYDDAAYHYDLLRKDYPKSEHQAQAHLLSLQSKMLAYQGPQYDATPLKEAGTLADQTLLQFGHQLPDERERLLKSKAAVHAQQAERDWDSGQYYRKLGYNRAARFYFNEVITKYPDTPFAEQARQGLDEISNLPDAPPDRFWWLTRWFGEPRRR